MLTKIASDWALAIATPPEAERKHPLCVSLPSPAGSLQEFLQTQCRVERHHFFRHDLAGNASAIETAVSGINHNGRKRISGAAHRRGQHQGFTALEQILSTGTILGGLYRYFSRARVFVIESATMTGSG